MTSDLFADGLMDYLESFVPPRVKAMQAMEAYAEQTGFPIIGPAAGYLCYQIARLIGARRVFEMGSGYGYSTAWLALAVQENGGGMVHHVVWDQELSNKARSALDTLGFSDIITYHVAEAVQTLQEVEGPFDLVFNDINKNCYPESLDVIDEKLRSGGVLLVDNMLWNGRIFDPEDQSENTRGVRELSRLVAQDPKWIASVVPIRDGLLLAIKK